MSFCFDPVMCRVVIRLSVASLVCSVVFQVLLPDGSPIVVDCGSTDTFWSLYEKLSLPLSSRPAWANKSISFALITYPHTRFDEQKFNISMREAGLVPSGTLRIELSK
jgi:hypothetical protein